MAKVQSCTSLRLAHMVDGAVQAGFPSPAEDYLDKPLNLNSFLIDHPHATFFLWVTGTSMVDAGIQDHDLLIVDRSQKPVNGDIVIASVNGDFTVKSYQESSQGSFLRPANSSFPIIPITEETNVEIWGVVMYVIHKTR